MMSEIRIGTEQLAEGGKRIGAEERNIGDFLFSEKTDFRNASMGCEINGESATAEYRQRERDSLFCNRRIRKKIHGLFSLFFLRARRTVSIQVRVMIPYPA